MTPTEVARLAAMGNALRADWPVPSLATYLNHSFAHRPYRDVAVALAYIATDGESKTPKRLEKPGPWWSVGPEASRLPEPPRVENLCDHGRDRDLCGCGTRPPRLDYAEISRQGAAAARASIARQVPPHVPETEETP